MLCEAVVIAAIVAIVAIVASHIVWLYIAYVLVVSYVIAYKQLKLI